MRARRIHSHFARPLRGRELHLQIGLERTARQLRDFVDDIVEIKNRSILGGITAERKQLLRDVRGARRRTLDIVQILLHCAVVLFAS